MKHFHLHTRFPFWLFIVFLTAFTGDSPTSQYIIPLSAVSVTAADLDLDGNIDIVTGHNYHSLTHWSGISVVENIGNGEFLLKDSIFFYGWQNLVMSCQLDDNSYSEIIFNNQIDNIGYIGILYNNDYDDIYLLSFNPSNGNGNDFRAIGDLDNNGYNDILFGSNSKRFWGVFYNFGYKNFSSPEYHDVNDYPPINIACGDLNNDGSDDVVICGQFLEVYISTTTGFQKAFVDYQAFKDKVAICDFDLDGWKDIIADNGSVVNSVWTNIYQNTGNGNFTKLEDHFFLPGASAFLINDFNNDSLPDIAYLNNKSIGDTNSGIHIVYNEGNFQISDPQYINIENLGEAQRNFHSADLDGNGYNDFAVVRGMGIPMKNLELLFNDGEGNFSSEPFVGLAENPKIKQQLACYPNPFCEHITFDYELDKTALVELVIIDLQGKLIKQVINQKQKGGHYSISWSGFSRDNAQHNTNVLVACLKVNGETQKSIKIIQL